MKMFKRIFLPVLICIIITFAFTACHSHNPEWRVDKDSHWRECECGEISELAEHSFELDICAVCSAERKTEDGKITEINVFNDYGDWIQQIFYDEDENPIGEYTARYTYDENGNKLSEDVYDGQELYVSCEYEYGSDGFTYKKYESEPTGDGGKYVIEFDENGDPVGTYEYDADGNMIEARRSEYLTDENGELVGEKVYINDVLSKEMKYASGSDGEEEYFYISEETNYSDDGSKLVEVYDEDGDVVREIAYDSAGEKLYDYELEYFYNDDGYETLIEKRENGVLRQEIVFEYDDEGNITAEKLYEDNKLLKESVYTAAENYFYVSKIITYNPDGTTSVEEYDEYDEIAE